MTHLTALAEKVEGAEGASRGLFEAAYAACNGGRLFDPPSSDGFRETFARWDRFRRLLDAEAWLDAAMTLTPEGCSAHIFSEVALAIIVRPFSGTTLQVARGFAATPALALTAAALRAHLIQQIGEVM